MRCVRMGSRAAESAATEGARPVDGGQDDSGSEVDALASSGLRAPVRAAHRPPSRDRRRRDCCKPRAVQEAPSPALRLH